MSIKGNMKTYSYYLMNQRNAYGELVIPERSTGVIEMDLQVFNQSTKDNILYTGATYIGLTQDYITDEYIIADGAKRLKVLYINTAGKYKQVFMCQV